MEMLFVCTGNTCRSPMAEGLMNHMAKKNGLDIEAKSAGIFTWVGQNVSEEAVEVIKEEGIDISSHKSRLITRNLVEEADLILTMTVGHKEQLLSGYGCYDFLDGKIYTLKEYAYGVEEDIEDPFGRGIQAYKNAKDEIKEAIQEIIDNGQLTGDR